MTIAAGILHGTPTHMLGELVYPFAGISTNHDGSFNFHSPDTEYLEEVSQGIRYLLGQWLQTEEFRILPVNTFIPSSTTSSSMAITRQRMEPAELFTTNNSPDTCPEKSPKVASVVIQAAKRSIETCKSPDVINNTQVDQWSIIDKANEGQIFEPDTISLVPPTT